MHSRTYYELFWDQDDISSSVWDWLMIFGGNKSLHCSPAVWQFIFALIASQYTAAALTIPCHVSGSSGDYVDDIFVSSKVGGCQWDLELQSKFNFAELKLYSWSQLYPQLQFKVVVIHWEVWGCSGGVGMSRCRWDLEPQSRFRGSGHPQLAPIYQHLPVLCLFGQPFGKSKFHFFLSKIRRTDS